jgi:crotonobetainyl-CoA:carnitine CoA-transferase CaiB-like acyl-CoA transferase
MAGALDGIRVIDCGRLIVGPLTAMFLTDQGAEVIHADPPAGLPWQTVAGHALKRRKINLTIGLKRAEGMELPRRLVEGTDAFSQNPRLGVATDLGFGYAQVSAREPNIICLSLYLIASSATAANGRAC